MAPKGLSPQLLEKTLYLPKMHIKWACVITAFYLFFLATTMLVIGPKESLHNLSVAPLDKNAKSITDFAFNLTMTQYILMGCFYLTLAKSDDRAVIKYASIISWFVMGVFSSSADIFFRNNKVIVMETVGSDLVTWWIIAMLFTLCDVDMTGDITFTELTSNIKLPDEKVLSGLISPKAFLVLSGICYMGSGVLSLLFPQKAAEATFVEVPAEVSPQLNALLQLASVSTISFAIIVLTVALNPKKGAVMYFVFTLFVTMIISIGCYQLGNSFYLVKDDMLFSMLFAIAMFVLGAYAVSSYEFPQVRDTTAYTKYINPVNYLRANAIISIAAILPAMLEPADTLSQMFSKVPEAGHGLDQLTFTAMNTYISILMMGVYAFVLSFSLPTRPVILAWSKCLFISTAMNIYLLINASDSSIVPATMGVNVALNCVLGLLGLYVWAYGFDAEHLQQ